MHFVENISVPLLLDERNRTTYVKETVEDHPSRIRQVLFYFVVIINMIFFYCYIYILLKPEVKSPKTELKGLPIS